MRPEAIEHVTLTGADLTVEQVVAVARHRCPVSIHREARHRVRCCRHMVDLLVARREKVYGLTTGFGKLRDISIAPQDLERLQINLIRSHACGVGDPFDEDVVRAATLLRANTLCRGNSGIRLETLEALVALLNDGIYPFVPCQGSLGASGDLAPLSHLALVLMGDRGGRFLPRHCRPSQDIVRGARTSEFVACGTAAWSEATLDGAAPTFQPVTLAAKEGLALNNGTQFMTALGCLVIHDAEVGVEWAELATAMSLEAMRGVRHAFAPEVHRARGLAHQGETAARILAHTDGSEILDVLLNTGHLRLARQHLHEIREHIATRRAELGLEGVDDRGEEADSRIDTLLDELARLIPEDPNVAAPDVILAHRDARPREQIAAYEDLVAPLRREATGLLNLLDQPSFPTSPLTRESAVRFLDALGAAVPPAPPVQDDYSTRCAPQVLGCVHRALEHARSVIGPELNAAVDNPLLFPPDPPQGFDAIDDEDYRDWLATYPNLDERVLGGGNFHGEPIGMVLDYLAIALAEVASIAERRVAHLVDASLSNGLPPFLVESSGLNSGFMIAQYTAASLVSENKVLAHPASVDSIPTCAGSEDHVSMGLIAARKAGEILDNALNVVAIEVLSAFQALSFRLPLLPGQRVGDVCAVLRSWGMRPSSDDRVMFPDIERIRDLLRAPPPPPGQRRRPGSGTWPKQDEEDA